MTKPLKILVSGAMLGAAFPFPVLAYWAFTGMEEFDVNELPAIVFGIFLIYLVSGVWLISGALGGFCGALTTCFLGDFTGWQRVRKLAFVIAAGLVVVYICSSFVLSHSPFATAW